uniref:BHLH domain-containing protein n=1 Tax=Arion vulgaris TaxID=1028688 RepID=A0A0B7B1R2_9EUPU
MKTIVATDRSRSSRLMAVKKDSSCSIMKNTSIDFHGEKLNVSDEMKECFLKLSGMVPDVPLNEEGNIDGTVLMQYVIDYILDLELQLDGHVTYSPTAAFATSLQSKFASDLSSSREPLSEKSTDNIISTQVQQRCQAFTEETFYRTSDCDLRPPSK